MSEQIMNSNSCNESSGSKFSILYDKTYDGKVNGTTESQVMGFGIDKIEGYKTITLDNIICGIISVDSNGAQKFSISRIEYNADWGMVYVHFSTTGSGTVKYSVNCKVIR